MSCLIGQPLANDAQQSRLGAHRVVHAESDPMVVAKIELGEIAMQVALPAVLIDAAHAALEHAAPKKPSTELV